jgi:CheY-like chemotaxis protein
MKKESPASARILLVDDIPSGLAARKLILMDHGYSVETAQSGEEAWELFQNNRFDVVVTDYRMKQMDGLELIRRVHDADTPARTVLLSGFLLAFDEQSSGADEVIQKSSREIPELLRVLKKLTARPRRRQPASAKDPAPRHKTQAV